MQKNNKQANLSRQSRYQQVLIACFIMLTAVFVSNVSGVRNAELSHTNYHQIYANQISHYSSYNKIFEVAALDRTTTKAKQIALKSTNNYQQPTYLLNRFLLNLSHVVEANAP